MVLYYYEKRSKLNIFFLFLANLVYSYSFSRSYFYYMHKASIYLIFFLVLKNLNEHGAIKILSLKI